jgi:hypothetical protein
MKILFRLTVLVLTLGFFSGQAGFAQEQPSALQLAEHQGEEHGTASKTIKGELLAIEGQYLVVKDIFGREVRLQVSQQTEQIRKFKPGDMIEIHASPIEHAMFIKAGKASPAQAPHQATPSKTIVGELVAIEGQYYVMKDQLGKEIRLYVSRDTEMAGAFKPGDMIEVQTSPVEHAVSIEPAK